MNGTQAQAIHHEPVAEGSFQGVAGGSIMESVGAIGAIILAIIGLAGILSDTMAAVTTIVVGAAILMEGGAMGSNYRRLLSMPGEGEWRAQQLSGGATAEFMGGVAGIVLGILALFGTAPQTLLSVAVLVFGATLLLSTAATAQLSGVGVFPGTESGQQTVVRDTTNRSGQVLVGLGAVVLGILSIIGLTPLTLILVALLSLGASALLSGSVLGGRLLSTAHR